MATGEYYIGGYNDAGQIIDGPSSLAWAQSHPGQAEPAGVGYGGSSAASEAMEAAMAEANEIAAAQLAISQRQAEISDERYKYWKENYFPLEEELVQKAKIGEDVGYSAERAGSEMGSGIDSSIGMYSRELQRLGIDPSNPKYSSLLKNYDTYRQAAIAGARNSARLSTSDKNRNMKLQIAGAGMGVPMQALSAYTSAANSMTQGANSKFTGAQGVANAYNTGAQAQLNAEQFNANLSANVNQLNFNQQKLMADQAMFNQRMKTEQNIYENQQEGQFYKAVGGLLGLGVGYGAGALGGMGAGAGGAGAVGLAGPSTAQIGGSAIGYGTPFML